MGEIKGRLSGRIALVTGAGSGIGAAIASRLAGEGAQVIFSDRNLASATDHAAQAGGTALELDVTSPQGWAAAVAFAEAQLGGLHILVHNAGICEPGTIDSIDLDDWHRNHAVNLDAVFLGCKTALPLMRQSVRESGLRGSIVTVASVSALVASANFASYNSSKAAVRHFTRSVALHCARERMNITANCILPAFVDTPLVDGFRPGAERAETLAKLARQIPLGRVGQVADVAGAAAFLCSDDAAFMTGADLVLDGGLSAQ